MTLNRISTSAAGAVVLSSVSVVASTCDQSIAASEMCYRTVVPAMAAQTVHEPAPATPLAAPLAVLAAAAAAANTASAFPAAAAATAGATPACAITPAVAAASSSSVQSPPTSLDQEPNSVAAVEAELEAAALLRRRLQSL